MGNVVEFFIDGENYYSMLYQQLVKAKDQILITDWWLTPEYYLKRPVSWEDSQMEKYRVDKLLGELANLGVKIFILIYKEVEVGFYHNSAHTKLTLQNMDLEHKNIKVMRHPRTIVSLWSHHEKIVVIDQAVAFIGGLDICLGRWDTQKHLLTDLPDEDGFCYHPGKDYSNDYIKGFSKVNRYTEDDLDRDTQPRMPWHDLHLMLKGDSAVDLGRHFIEYWNHAMFDKSRKVYRRQSFLRPHKAAIPLDPNRDEEKNGSCTGFFSDSDQDEEEKLSPILKHQPSNNNIFKQM